MAGLAIAACSDNSKQKPLDGGFDGAGDGAFDARLPPPKLVCGEGVTGSLAAEKKLEVSGAAAKDLAGSAVFAPRAAKTAKVAIQCNDKEIVPAEYVALGPAVKFTPAALVAPADYRFTLPFVAARMPAGARSGSIVVWMERRGRKTLLPLVDPLVDLAAGRLTFSLDELASFQVGIAKKAGSQITRRYTYRAVVGFSMGGGAAAVLGTRHPEMFDFIGPLGSEPGVELNYQLAFIEDAVLGGFCTADDQKLGRGKIGELCDNARKPLERQHELTMTWEKQLYQKGLGVGLTLDRETYTKALRDLVRAYGNAAYHNPKSPYLPPGIPESYLQRGEAACGDPVRLKKFYDREFNPKGAFDVITFCDGHDSSKKGAGVFDPAIKQRTPMQVLLAVDVNGNGKRDSGEPIVLHSREPYEDVGVDGKADKDEPGYDPVTNPDPANDNFHYLKNPTGTEGNWRYDKGEPYEDVGVDGVKGTCQAGTGADCYDYGEGNGKHDLAAMAQRWIDHDPASLFAKLPAAQRARIDIWTDAGIRDFFNAHVATNQFIGELAAAGEPVRLFQSFKWIGQKPDSSLYDFNNVDWRNVGKHGYVRYGDPSVSRSEVEMTGDGRHVGTALQVANRTTSFFAFVQARWPKGDRETRDAALTSANFKENLSFRSPSTGQDRPFSLFLPPGYFNVANKDRRYPVIYFFHGYGMEPKDLIALSGLFANYMVSKTIRQEKRFQKFIIVYVDGRCRPGGKIPLPKAGDRCEQGTFYLDSPDKTNTAQMETLTLELIAHIDKTYRTRKAEDIEITAY